MPSQWHGTNSGSCPLYGCTCLICFKKSKNSEVESYTQSKEYLYRKRFRWKSLLQRNSHSTKALADHKVLEQLSGGKPLVLGPAPVYSMPWLVLDHRLVLSTHFTVVHMGFGTQPTHDDSDASCLFSNSIPLCDSVPSTTLFLFKSEISGAP